MNNSPVRGSIGRRSKLYLAMLASLALVPAAFAADSGLPVEINLPVPIISADEAVQKELLNLDRLLETNPKLEETLRENVDRLYDATFRAKNPEVDTLLKKNPGLERALRTERHFFVMRIVGRLARGKMLRKDVADLDKFLAAHADIRAALVKQPRQIVQSDFLIAHPSLAKFMEEHPSLSTVLLQHDDEAPKKTQKGRPQAK